MCTSPCGVHLPAQSGEPVDQPHRFAGNYQDPAGLYHLQARYYDANIGRFTQPDPSGQEQNPYLYAAGDPVNRIDPSGTSFMSFAESASKKAGFVSDAPWRIATQESMTEPLREVK